MRDEKLYSDPYAFKPERFLEKVDPEMERKRDPRNYVFGFGRRFVWRIRDCQRPLTFPPYLPGVALAPIWLRLPHGY
jgi:hypothetical protein